MANGMNGGDVDYQGNDSPTNFYAPDKTDEQKKEEAKRRELNIAQIDIVEEVVADFEEFFTQVSNVNAVDSRLFKEVSAEAQILGLQFGSKFASAMHKKYMGMLKERQDSSLVPPEENNE